MKRGKSSSPTAEQEQAIQQALVLHQYGQLAEAAARYKQLLKKLPDHTLLLNCLGGIDYQQGRFAEVLNIMHRSLLADPRQPAALVLQGLALHHLQRYPQAIASYQRAMALDAADPLACHNLGNTLLALQRHEEALSAYAQAVARNPAFVPAYVARGLTLLAVNQPQQALHSYDSAIALQADAAPAYGGRGAALLTLQRYAEALADLERAIRLEAGDARTHSLCGVALLCLKRPAEALPHHQQAVHLNPGDGEAYTNLGNTLKVLNRLEEALAAYQRALELNPGDVETCCNLGNTLKDLQRLAAARACYDQAIALDGACAAAWWNKALLAILQGDYVNGWALYEWGWRSGQRRSAASFTQPLWLGETALTGKTLLIYPEQGLGDYIQCLRYAPRLAQQAGRVILQLPAALLGLAASQNNGCTLLACGQPLPDFDCCCPVMSLPLAFKTSLVSIPAEIPYLYADDDRQRFWRQRLGEKTLLRVGLAWSGSPEHPNDHNRSMAFAQLAGLLDGDFEFHCLQQVIRAEDAAQVDADGRLHLHGEALQDMADTAALLAEMDVVITVDTAIAHLAGALGARLWVLLPYAPDYRWLLERVDSPWYPTATLFRQQAAGDWAGVVSAVAAALALLGVSDSGKPRYISQDY